VFVSCKIFLFPSRVSTTSPYHKAYHQNLLIAFLQNFRITPMTDPVRKSIPISTQKIQYSMMWMNIYMMLSKGMILVLVFKYVLLMKLNCFIFMSICFASLECFSIGRLSSAYQFIPIIFNTFLIRARSIEQN